MTTRRASFRSALDALSRSFVDDVMRAIWRAVLTDLAGAQVADPVPMTAASRAGSKARKAVQRLKATSPSDPERTSSPRKAPPALLPARRQLELPLEIHEYPETVIVDPDALLAASPPTVVAVGEASADVAPVPPASSPQPHPSPRTIRRPRSSSVAPTKEDPAPQRAPAVLVPRAGEEVLRAAGGGVVLRRRRAPPPSPAGAEE